jgi:hypothetical protein
MLAWSRIADWIHKPQFQRLFRRYPTEQTPKVAVKGGRFEVLLPEKTMSTVQNARFVVRFDDERALLVETEDGDRFLTTVAEVASVLRIVDPKEILKFQKEYSVLSKRLLEWLRIHRDVAKTAYLTARDHGLIFIVIPKQPKYDREFEDFLSDLDLEIANDPRFPTIRLSVMQLPTDNPDGLGCFISNFQDPDAEHC